MILIMAFGIFAAVVIYAALSEWRKGREVGRYLSRKLHA